MTTPDNASGQGSVAAAAPGETTQSTTKNRKSAVKPPAWTLVLITAGALVIIATYITVLFVEPPLDEFTGNVGNSALWTMVGYTAGGALITAGALPRIPRSIIALLPFMIALNIVSGQLIGNTPLPLYLDSWGTVIIAVLAGPSAGVVTGILTNLIWGVTLSPSVIAFTGGAAFVGAAAGWAARLGAFRRPWWPIIAGALVGIPAGLVGTAVAVTLFMGGLGLGTGGAVAGLQAAGLGLWEAATLQGVLSDIADKAIIFVVAFGVVWALPKRMRSRLPFTRHSVPTDR